MIDRQKKQMLRYHLQIYSNRQDLAMFSGEIQALMDEYACVAMA